ncbi:MAG: hypothetical protein H8E66_31380 [Planctomycetes bacterium]|nr:hypothetical protein [Planctomycetota bacterium]
MKNIDFLPERYRERDLKRRAAIWQYALLFGFGGVLLAATIGQFAMKRSLQTSLSELKESRIATNVKRERVKLLKQQLGETDEIAALYTYLRHPWPKTQLIVLITESIPDSVVLEGVEVLDEAPQRSFLINSETQGRQSAESPAAADLAVLRGDHDSTQLIVRVRGTVDDTAALNGYVQQLSEVPLFRSVSLSSLQATGSPQEQSSRDKSPRSSFELNVIVRPGHGQPGGPTGPIAAHDQLAQHLITRDSP